MSGLHEALREACAEVGIVPKDVPADGKWHLADVDGGGRGNGRIKLFPDGAGGRVCNWEGGDGTHTFFVRQQRPMSEAERIAHARRVQERKRLAEVEDAKERAEAAAKAAKLWAAAKPINGHPYLIGKKVKPTNTLREMSLDHAAAILGYRPQAKGEPLAGRLIVAPVKVGDAISTAELIDESGRKSAVAGGRKAGGYWASSPLPPGDGAGLMLPIGEGVATALTGAEASGGLAIAALSCGNLPEVARDMRRRYPMARLIILSDIGNGEADARKAAMVSGAALAVPDFGPDKPDKASDFNDLAALAGIEAVRLAIEAAKPVEAPQAAETAPPLAYHSPAAFDASGAAEWPEPKSLPVGLPPVAQFDPLLLPDSLRPWAEDICERIQCPHDFVGVTVMAALGSVLGRKVGIRPQEKTDWVEFGNQWALIVGRPGVLKSPAMEAALAPIKRLAGKASSAYQIAMEDYGHALKVAKLQQEAGEKAAREKIKKSGVSANVKDDLSIPDPEPPQLRCYIANDTSYEKLGEILAANPNGVLVYRDELVSLLKTLDREDNAAARGFYLTGWGGNSPYNFDRIARGHVAIPAVCLSMLGSTQPGRIAEYIRSAVKGGSGDDGLIQRFGLLVWPDIGGEWKNVDRWPDTDARKRANEVFEMLDQLDPSEVYADQDRDFGGMPDGQPFLRFSPDALEEFQAWREPYEIRLRSGEEHPALESHIAKYRKLAPSLALVLHLANGNKGEVDRVSLVKALAWIEYLETHARRAYASVSSPEIAAAKAILERLRRGEIEREFAPHEIYRKGWAHLSDRQLVKDALDLLTDLGWVIPRTIETTGRWAQRYEANPRGFKQ